MLRTIMGRKVYVPLDPYKTTRRIEIRILKRYLDVQPDDVLCDLGSGTGYWTEHIAGRAYCVGLDIMWRDTRIAARYHRGPHTDFVLGNMERLPFPDATFTKTFGVCTIEHVPDKDAAFAEFSRCLKPGGVLAMTVDSLNYPGITDERRQKHAERYNVAHLYNRQSLTTTLEDNGFEVTELIYFLNSPLSHTINLLVDRFPRLHYAAFPASYPLTVLSDRLMGHPEAGWKMAVRAVKRA